MVFMSVAKCYCCTETVSPNEITKIQERIDNLSLEDSEFIMNHLNLIHCRGEPAEFTEGIANVCQSCYENALHKLCVETKEEYCDNCVWLQESDRDFHFCINPIKFHYSGNPDNMLEDFLQIAPCEEFKNDEEYKLTIVKRPVKPKPITILTLEVLAGADALLKFLYTIITPSFHCFYCEVVDRDNWDDWYCFNDPTDKTLMASYVGIIDEFGQDDPKDEHYLDYAKDYLQQHVAPCWSFKMNRNLRFLMSRK
jgi:hypothetical protein